MVLTDNSDWVAESWHLGSCRLPIAAAEHRKQHRFVRTSCRSFCSRSSVASATILSAYTCAIVLTTQERGLTFPTYDSITSATDKQSQRSNEHVVGLGVVGIGRGIEHKEESCRRALSVVINSLKPPTFLLPLSLPLPLDLPFFFDFLPAVGRMLTSRMLTSSWSSSSRPKSSPSDSPASPSASCAVQQVTQHTNCRKAELADRG